MRPPSYLGYLQSLSPPATRGRGNGFTADRPAAAHPPLASAFEPIADPLAGAGPQGAAARFR
jgi:hypothetical protein